MKNRQNIKFCKIEVQKSSQQLRDTVRAPVFGRHQFFGTSEHYGKAHGSLLSGWMNYYYTACCWFPTSSNILIRPSQFWQIRFESYWSHYSKCWILVLLRYHYILSVIEFFNTIPMEFHWKYFILVKRNMKGISGMHLHWWPLGRRWNGHCWHERNATDTRRFYSEHMSIAGAV